MSLWRRHHLDFDAFLGYLARKRPWIKDVGRNSLPDLSVPSLFTVDLNFRYVAQIDFIQKLACKEALQQSDRPCSRQGSERH
jgi:hypothetical protein